MDSFKEKADENLVVVSEDLQKENKRFERKMLLVLAISTLLTIAIIFLLPLKNIKDFIILAMVIALAIISNTLNIVALSIRKKK